MSPCPCRRCAELENRLRDPDPRLRDADGATRYALVSHLIRDHGRTAGPLPGCETCLRWEATPGIAPALAARWSLHHYVSHHIPTRRPPIRDQPTTNACGALTEAPAPATSQHFAPPS